MGGGSRNDQPSLPLIRNHLAIIWQGPRPTSSVLPIARQGCANSHRFSNNAERALRGVTVGRRNWTFAGSDAGGNRATAVYTLIETCLCRARHKPPSSTTSPPRLGLPTCWLDYRMTLPNVLTTCCPGIG